jgi:hypothetical protein
VIVAINQIGIAANLVNTLFIGFVAALALAFGLAFGLGGREVAAQLTQEWYNASRSTAERVRASSSSSSASSPAMGRSPAQPPQQARPEGGFQPGGPQTMPGSARPK